MPAVDPVPPTIEWRRDSIRLVDQRALPGRLRFLTCRDVDGLVDAIATLAIRGAPALGAAGAFGVALAARSGRTKSRVRSAARRVARSRPTAVNLAWGVERALAAFESGGADAALATAQEIAADDVRRNRIMGAIGAHLVPTDGRVPIATRGRSRRSATAPASGSCAPRSNRDAARRCGPARPGRCSRARG